MFGSATNDDGNVETFSRVIFIISMGKEASASKMVERFVWSARYRGEWRGYIVLLTDAPKSRYEGLSHHFIVMNPQPNHFNGSFPLDMPYKRFKTHLLEYVGMDPRLNPAKLVYYLDVDNIVGNSLPRMFEGLVRTLRDLCYPSFVLQCLESGPQIRFRLENLLIRRQSIISPERLGYGQFHEYGSSRISTSIWVSRGDNSSLIGPPHNHAYRTGGT